MYRNTELRLIAMFDQANAAHREAVKHFRKFADDLSKLPPDFQRRTVECLDRHNQIATYILSDATDTQWIIDLVPVEVRSLVESWNEESPEDD